MGQTEQQQQEKQSQSEQTFQWKSTLVKGGKTGLLMTWTLGKIIFPVTLLVTILQYSGLLDWVIKAVAPFMHWLGLPGEAAIPLVLANALNLYAGIGAILTMELTVKHVFILAVMMSFSHNLFVESTVAAKVGVKLWVVALVRIALALLSAFVIHHVWNGGGEIAQYGIAPPTNEVVEGWLAISLKGIETAFFGVVQLAAIVIPLMIGIQILKDLRWIAIFSRWMRPFTRMLGMQENTSMTLASGIFFGLAFGAGVMIQAVKEDNVKKRDLYLAFIFLVSCHAVIEDTLVFIPLGIPVWPLLLIRLGVAIILTMAIAFVWRKYSTKPSQYGEEATDEH